VSLFAFRTKSVWGRHCVLYASYAWWIGYMSPCQCQHAHVDPK